MLLQGEPPVVHVENGCNIAAAAGNTWSPRGPLDAVVMLCRVCQERDEVPLGADEDFRERALFLAGLLARTCTRSCAMPCVQDETV